MALRETIAARALDLLEGLLGKGLVIAAFHHARDQPVAEMGNAAGQLEGRHGAAQENKPGTANLLL